MPRDITTSNDKKRGRGRPILQASPETKAALAKALQLAALQGRVR